MAECKVKFHGDGRQLRGKFFITLEPPYWYLRCITCNRRWYLPWDSRMRTDDAMQQLIDHGKQRSHSAASRSLAHSENAEREARHKQTGENSMDISKFLGSTFLKVEDIKASGPVRVTITDVSEGRFGKLDLTFDDGTQLSLNSTNARVLTRAYGLESNDWINKQVELVVGEIKYDGKMNEAVLINPISPPIENKPPPKPDLDD